MFSKFVTLILFYSIVQVPSLLVVKSKSVCCFTHLNKTNFLLQIDGRPDETASPIADSRTGSTPCRDGELSIYIFYEVGK